MAYQWGGRRILDLAIHPDGKKVFVLISGLELRVYDLETKSDELFFKSDVLISCISLSPLGKYLLVNFIQVEELTCLEIGAELIVAKYSGLKEQRYVTRPCFSGSHSEIIVSGSEGMSVRPRRPWSSLSDGIHHSLLLIFECVHRRRKDLPVAARHWEACSHVARSLERDQHCSMPSDSHELDRECKRRRDHSPVGSSIW